MIKFAIKGGNTKEITYIRKGDYLYPNLALDPADDVDLGKYGQMRRRYLREHREAMYWGMYVEDTLTKHLLEVDETAQVQVDMTVKRLLKQYPAPDRDVDFLAYVGHMNNLTAMAEEAVLLDLIYA